METKYNNCANKGGVYKILNTANNRFYYGSAKDFKDRKRSHLTKLRNNKHSNNFLQHDFNKCGENVFIFEVVEVVQNIKQDRWDREQLYLNLYYDNQILCYNIDKIAHKGHRTKFSNTPLETKKLLSQKSKAMWADPEHRVKLKKIHSDHEWIKNQSKKQKEVSQNPNYGNSSEANRKRFADSKEKEKHSQALKQAWQEDDGTRRKQASLLAKRIYKANKEKIAIARLKAKAKFHGKVISPDGKVYEIYNLDSFCREHGIKSCGTFWSLMHGKIQTYKGWKKLQT